MVTFSSLKPRRSILVVARSCDLRQLTSYSESLAHESHPDEYLCCSFIS